MINKINSVLASNGIQETISLIDISITDNVVSDLVKENPKLSNIITDSIWPSISNQEVYHYTSKEAAESILNSEEFRLYSILKRADEGEMETFCKNHNLSGYLAEDKNGDPLYKREMMTNMFYASFTDTKITTEQNDYFWRVFASCDGVRFKFKIEATNENFRKIVYENHKGKGLKLLQDLTKEIKNNYDRDFILKGISRLGAFYLGDEYRVENEYRMLHREWGNTLIPLKFDDKFEYISFPLEKMSPIGFKISILEIETNEKLVVPSKYNVGERTV